VTMQKFYITTPIYYVNDVPHIGHAYTTTAADILARWHRLAGDDTYFLTGTDEHGAKIAEAAQKRGVSPQQLCDENSATFKKAWETLNVSNDDFVRTTQKRHSDTVSLILKKMFDSGVIYKKKYEGLYCVPCEKFLSEEDLNEDKCCPDHKQKPVTHSEENYFFKLSQYKDELTRILENGDYAVFPIERRNELLGKLKKTGLEDISISRASLEWGIPLPFDEKQTAYVWVDALVNYVSAIGYSDNPGKFKRYWPCDVHLMAKDILWFHGIIWPAILLAAGLPLPKKMFAHGFFTIDGQKMSKTLGNVITPDQLVARFGTDASRYLLISLFPFGVDGDISWKALIERYNNDLANNLGNLVSRTLTMAEKYFEGKVPEVKDACLMPASIQVKETLEPIAAHLDNFEFHLAIEKLQNAIDICNRLVQDKAPWKMAKENNPELPYVIFTLIQSIGLISIYLYPIMPSVSKTIWTGIGQKEDMLAAALKFINKSDIELPVMGSPVLKPQILFPRVDVPKISK